MKSANAIIQKRPSQKKGIVGSNKQSTNYNKTWVEIELFKSKAWMSLTGIAPQVYSLFLARRKSEYVGRKKGKEQWVVPNFQELEFTYAEAEKKYGITQRRFTKAIDCLIDTGFLDIIERGGGLFKCKTIYGLSERWRKFGTIKFEEAKRPKRLVQHGYCKSDEKKK